MKVCNNLDEISGVPTQSGKHSEASCTEDIRVMVEEFHKKSGVFTEIQGDIIVHLFTGTQLTGT